ncbi:hypothetical protein LCGC14_2089440 [marine sediment metagenome]|uniref:Uncharacterized protein n=1 Tax=marine sediment metagenome TaxID=412755 RepID=A0A0F9GRC4_9ZZZZ
MDNQDPDLMLDYYKLVVAFRSVSRRAANRLAEIRKLEAKIEQCPATHKVSNECFCAKGCSCSCHPQNTAHQLANSMPPRCWSCHAGQPTSNDKECWNCGATIPTRLKT